MSRSIKGKFFLVLIFCFLSSPLFAQGEASQHLESGIRKHKKHNYAAAIQDYDRAIELEPNSVEIYFNRGLAKSESGNYPEALTDFDKVISLDETNDSAYFNRGIVKYELKDYDGALKDFNKTLELVPGDAKALFNRATTKYALGDQAGSLKDAAEARRYFKLLHKRDAYLEVTDFMNSVRQNESSQYY
jgi:tetratricopeptide (TPR) repeat protein